MNHTHRLALLEAARSAVQELTQARPSLLTEIGKSCRGAKVVKHLSPSYGGTGIVGGVNRPELRCAGFDDAHDALRFARLLGPGWCVTAGVYRRFVVRKQK